METATENSKIPPQKIPSSDEQSQEARNVTDSSPVTPTASSSSSWWGGFISQAKEKVNNKKVSNSADKIYK
jgi:hypothetical protein